MKHMHNVDELVMCLGEFNGHWTNTLLKNSVGKSTFQKMVLVLPSERTMCVK